MIEKGSIEAKIFGLHSLSYIFFASVHRGGAGDACEGQHRGRDFWFVFFELSILCFSPSVRSW